MNMRYYMLRLLLVFVCLFVLFSHSLTVCATDSSEEISTFFGTEYPIIYENPYIMRYSNNISGYSVSLSYRDINGATIPFSGSELDLTDSEVYFNNDGRVLLLYIIVLPETIGKNEIFDLDIIFSNSSGTVEFDSLNLYDSNYRGLSSTKTFVNSTQSKINTRFSFNDVSSSSGAIKRMHLYFIYTPSEGVTTFNSTMQSIVITEVSSNGLLSSIIEFLKSIWDGIKNLPSNIANSIKGFFDNVVNALTTLGNFIIDGIKGLFIPSEEDITSMKEKWETLLSDRFGALYQVCTLISNYASAFQDQSKGTITFPTVSIPLAGTTFEFGGWEVQVVPDGFGFLFDAIKMIISIVATILFVNGLRNKFDKILGGADDI